jgi:uncharacterized protein
MNAILNAALVFLLILPQAVPGQRVYDFAQQLSEQSKNELHALSREVETKTTAEIAFVTVYSLDGETIDDYANKLFNSWGIGKKDVNNGVLFLIAPIDRRVRIEVGYGLEPLLTDALCGEILDNYVIPRFKEGKLDEGVIDGARELTRILLEYPEAARGIPGSAPKGVKTKKQMMQNFIIAPIAASILFLGISLILSSRKVFPASVFYLGILVVAALCGYGFWQFYQALNGKELVLPVSGVSVAALIGLFTSYRKYRRFGPHYCTSCGTKLELLNEQTDDEFLSDVQKLEEQLGSVDYDVWMCPSCLKKDVDQYVKAFSSLSKCPKCSNHTLKVVTTVITAATRNSSGMSRENRDCVYCKFSDVRNKTIPRITSSSGSSGGGGSSFGGGSSGGGGSSRGW